MTKRSSYEATWSGSPRRPREAFRPFDMRQVFLREALWKSLWKSCGICAENSPPDLAPHLLPETQPSSPEATTVLVLGVQMQSPESGGPSPLPSDAGCGYKEGSKDSWNTPLLFIEAPIALSAMRTARNRRSRGPSELGGPLRGRPEMTEGRGRATAQPGNEFPGSDRLVLYADGPESQAEGTFRVGFPLRGRPGDDGGTGPPELGAKRAHGSACRRAAAVPAPRAGHP